MGEKSEAWDPGTNKVMNSLGFHCAFCFSELNVSVNWKYQWTKIKTKQSFPNMNPPPTSHPMTSLWISPVHQPQASCIYR